jgi:hypothetical protein
LVVVILVVLLNSTVRVPAHFKFRKDENKGNYFHQFITLNFLYISYFVCSIFNAAMSAFKQPSRRTKFAS